jgi:hypothetical protein
MKTRSTLMRATAAALWLALAAVGMAHADGVVGTTFPAGFPDIPDASLGVPVIGFGGAGPATRTPVVFLHGNNGTPYLTGCGMFQANIQGMAQHFADKGYSPSELWAVGYQGTQCDLNDQPANASSVAHTVAANVVDLRKFLKAVVASTRTTKVDIVAHGTAVVLVRELARQDNGADYVRRLVAIEGANQGMNICAAVRDNSWALGMYGGYTPSSPVCQELGSPSTSFLQQLNKTDRKIPAANILVVRNGDFSFLYRTGWDGLVQGAPAAVDSFGRRFDFSLSPVIAGAQEIVRNAATDLANGIQPTYMYDFSLATAHVGIANDPVTWNAAFDFLTKPEVATTTTKSRRK